MRRGRATSRGSCPISPRRVGRPPKSDAGVLAYGRSYYEGLRIPSGVIRSNFGRRCSFGGRTFRNFGNRGNHNNNTIRSRGGGRGRHSSTGSQTTRSSSNSHHLVAAVGNHNNRSFNNNAIANANANNSNYAGRSTVGEGKANNYRNSSCHNHDDDDDNDCPFVEDQAPSTSSSTANGPAPVMNGFADKRSSKHTISEENVNDYDDDAIPCSSSSKSSSVIRPGRLEDVNLLALIAGGTTVKDLVCLSNLRKLSTAAQQHLLKMLPKRDCTVLEDGTLEPTFSALKNEYLSAALLDFNERLYNGEISPTGEIFPVPPSPSRSPIASTNSAAAATTLPPIVDEATSSSSSSSSSGVSSSSRRSSNARDDNDGDRDPVHLPQPALPQPPQPLPPLPRMRINLASKIITFIPQDAELDGDTNSWSSSVAGVLVTRRFTNERNGDCGDDGTPTIMATSTATSAAPTTFNGGGNMTMVNGIAATKTVGSLTEVDLTPLFVSSSSLASSQVASNSNNYLMVERNKNNDKDDDDALIMPPNNAIGASSCSIGQSPTPPHTYYLKSSKSALK